MEVQNDKVIRYFGLSICLYLHS